MSPQRMQPPERIQEPMETLKGRIMGQLNGKFVGPFALAFTSCVQGEGVTTVASNFAASLAADVKRRIIYMDGNLQRVPKTYPLLPELPEALDGKLDPEESDLKLPARPIWQIVNANSNIDMMYSRLSFANPGRVFGAARFNQLISQLKERYDFVIVDCPPLLGVSGGSMLAAQCDGAVMVIESGRVRRQVLQRSVMNLEATGANVLGVVLNKRDYDIPDFIYKRL